MRVLRRTGPVVMRFKGDVPAGVLVPHVVAMFFGMMIGVRAALAAAFARPEARRYAWVTVVLLGIGGPRPRADRPEVRLRRLLDGLALRRGPHGQQDARHVAGLGRWPSSCWAGAATRPTAGPAGTVAAAAAVMLAVYLVPHSLRGSQLDYAKVEGGAAAKDAITTGR